jgi:hypothetical protein
MGILIPRDRPVVECGAVPSPAPSSVVLTFPHKTRESEGSADVERIDLYAVYRAGAELSQVSNLGTEDVIVSKIFFQITGGVSALRVLLSENSPAALHLSRQSANELLDALNSLVQYHFYDDKGGFNFPPPEKKAEWHLMARIANAYRTFEPVFRAEMQESATYRVPKRGILNIGDLVDRASETFPGDVLSMIGPVARKEYDAAGRCYAFGLYTASGYHSCRAVEAVLRPYFRYFTGKADDGTEVWGKLIDALEKADPRPDEKTLSHIRHIKDYDRNPLSHLRADLDATDADVLMSYAKVAITVMARELIAAKINENQPSLALVSPNDEQAA